MLYEVITQKNHTKSKLSIPYKMFSWILPKKTNYLWYQNLTGNKHPKQYYFRGHRITSYNVCYTKLLRNVKDGGMAFGANPEVAGLVTKKVREVLSKPLIVKLSPNVSDIVQIAKIVEENGADAVALINTLLGMAIDIKKKKPILGIV